MRVKCFAQQHNTVKYPWPAFQSSLMHMHTQAIKLLRNDSTAVPVLGKY